MLPIGKKLSLRRIDRDRPRKTERERQTRRALRRYGDNDGH